MTTIVIVLPNAREAESVRALLAKGLIITTTRTRRRELNLASNVPILNVIQLPNRRKKE